MIIKKYIQYIKEFSGTELIGNIGPGYGETKLKNKTVNKSHTNVIYCELDNKFYTEDEWNELHNNYLKSGGKPLNGFSLENIEKIISTKKPS